MTDGPLIDAPVDTAQTPAGPGPLRARVARAAFTSGGGEIASRLALIVVSILSARLLEPREVGFLGAAVIVIGVISVVGSFAETGSITLPKSENSARIALAATVLRGAVVALLLGGSVAIMYLLGSKTSRAGASEVIGLISVLSWTLLLEVIATYPRTILQRELRLDFIAVVQIFQMLIYFSLGVWFLAQGGRTRGLAIAQVIATIFVTVVVWARFLATRTSKWEGWPALREWRTTARRAGALFIGLIGGFLCERVDNIMVGASIGTTAMSFYSMAWNASHMPANVFSRAINFVLVPTLPHLHDEPQRIERALEECLRYSYLLLAPVCAVLVVTAPELVSVVLGRKWMPLVPCLRIMAFSVVSAPLLFASTALLVGTGRAMLTSIATAVHFCLLLTVIPLVARKWGIVGAAYGELGSVAILTIVLWITTRRATGLVNRSILRAPLLFIIAAACAGAAASVARALTATDVFRLSLSCTVIAVAYIGFVVLFGERSAIVSFGDLLRSSRMRSAVAQNT